MSSLYWLSHTFIMRKRREHSWRAIGQDLNLLLAIWTTLSLLHKYYEYSFLIFLKIELQYIPIRIQTYIIYTNRMQYILLKYRGFFRFNMCAVIKYLNIVLKTTLGSFYFILSKISFISVPINTSSLLIKDYVLIRISIHHYDFQNIKLTRFIKYLSNSFWEKKKLYYLGFIRLFHQTWLITFYFFFKKAKLHWLHEVHQ